MDFRPISTNIILKILRCRVDGKQDFCIISLRDDVQYSPISVNSGQWHRFPCEKDGGKQGEYSIAVGTPLSQCTATFQPCI